METVLAEFKAYVADEHKKFKALPKEERKKVRNNRNSYNEHVEELTKDWKKQMEEIDWQEFSMDLDTEPIHKGGRNTIDYDAILIWTPY